MKIDFRPGDLFCSHDDGALPWAIRLFQKVWAQDGEAFYNHGGVILDCIGTCAEALWTVKVHSFLEMYAGKQVLVGRDIGMTLQRFQECYARIEGHIGDPYPAWRLLLHMFPPLARISLTGMPVCTEFAWKFIDGNHWAGVTPDILADRIKLWDRFEVVFEGQL